MATSIASPPEPQVSTRTKIIKPPFACNLCGIVVSPLKTSVIATNAPSTSSKYSSAVESEEMEEFTKIENRSFIRKGFQFICQNLDAEELWDSLEEWELNELKFCTICSKLIKSIYELLFEIDIIELRLDAKIIDVKDRIILKSRSDDLRKPAGRPEKLTEVSRVRIHLIDKAMKMTSLKHPTIKLTRLTDHPFPTQNLSNIDETNYQDQEVQVTKESEDSDADYLNDNEELMEIDTDDDEEYQTDTQLDLSTRESSMTETTLSKDTTMLEQLPIEPTTTGKKSTDDLLPTIKLSRIEVPKRKLTKYAVDALEDIEDIQEKSLDSPKNDETMSEVSESDSDPSYVPSFPRESDESDSDFENESNAELNLQISNPRSLSEQKEPTPQSPAPVLVTSSLTGTVQNLQIPSVIQFVDPNPVLFKIPHPLIPTSKVQIPSVRIASEVQVPPIISCSVTQPGSNEPAVPGILIGLNLGGKKAIPQTVYRCDYCPTVFVNKLPIISHYKELHEGKPRFCCLICDREFLLSQDLSMHKIRDHNQTKSNISASNSLELDVNEKIKQLESQRKIIPKKIKKPYKCRLCGELHRLQQSLEMHFKEKHVGLRPFTCPQKLCDRESWRRGDILTHMERAHGNEQNQRKTKNPVNFVIPLPVQTVAKKPDTWLNAYVIKPQPLPDSALNINPANVQKVEVMEEFKNNCKGHALEERTDSKLENTPNPKKKRIRIRRRRREDPHVLTPCPECSEQFPKSGIPSHLLSHETENKNYHCTCCEKAFTLQPNLEIHMKYHELEKELPFGCSKCEIRFKVRIKLTHHMEREHSDIECKLCGKLFFDEVDLKAHHKFHSEGKRIYVCDLCEKGYSRKTVLEDHIARVHEGKKPSKCNDCGKSFGNHRFLKVHINHVHMKKKKKIYKYPIRKRSVICELCGKVISTRQGFKMHIERHTKSNGELRRTKSKGKVIECPICPKSGTGFSSGDNYVNMEGGTASETGLDSYDPQPKQKKIQTFVPKAVDEYNCRICTLHHTSQEMLQNHFKSYHEGIKPFTCPYEPCKTSAWQRGDIRKHVDHVHNHKPKPAKPKRHINCAYAILKDIKKKNVPRVQKEFKCPHCSKSLLYKRTLKHHIILCHGQYECHICPTRRQTREELVKHFELHKKRNQWVEESNNVNVSLMEVEHSNVGQGQQQQIGFDVDEAVSHEHSNNVIDDFSMKLLQK